MKVFKFLAIIFAVFAITGTANLFTCLICSWDFCFFTFTPVSELKESTATILGIGTIASFPLCIACINTFEK